MAHQNPEIRQLHILLLFIFSHNERPRRDMAELHRHHVQHFYARVAQLCQYPTGFGSIFGHQ
jgi:hypothetical protein